MDKAGNVRTKFNEWKVMICADGTVHISVYAIGWQEFLCEPEQAWSTQVRHYEDGA